MFTNVIGVTIEGLEILDCGHWVAQGSYAALEFNNVADLTIFRVTVNLSLGIGLYIRNARGKSLVNSSAFLCRQVDTNGVDCHARNEHQSSLGNVTRMPNVPDCTPSYCRNADIEYKNCKSSSAHFKISSSEFRYGYDEWPRHTASGISLILDCSEILVTMDSLIVSDNIGSQGGNLFVQLTQPTSSVDITNCNITNGVALINGGGVYVRIDYSRSNKTCSETRKVFQLSNSIVHHNTAMSGGGLQIDLIGLYPCNQTITVSHCTFSSNVASTGAAIHRKNYLPSQHSLHSILQMQTVLHHNSVVRNCHNGGDTPILPLTTSSVGAALYVEKDAYMYITGTNIFEDNYCSALLAVRSTLILTGNLTVRRNLGISGGGIAFCERSFMVLEPHTYINIAANSVRNVGGGIFSANSHPSSQVTCFFQLSVQVEEDNLDTIHVHLTGNNATMGGSALYGGLIDDCYLINPAGFINSSTLFEALFIYPKLLSTPNLSTIASDPDRLCFCDHHGRPQCDRRYRDLHTLSGTTHSMSVMVVGQREGAVAGGIDILFNDTDLTVNTSYSLQSYTPECLNFSYTLYSNKSAAQMLLTAVDRHRMIPTRDATHSNRSLSIAVHFTHCPPGLNLTTHPPYHCDCFNKVLDKGVLCSFNEVHNATFKKTCRDRGNNISIWIGYSGNITNVGQLYMYVPCPKRYCTKNCTVMTISSLDAQCVGNRTGVLCGICSQGYSTVLGTNNCLVCSNAYLALLIPFSFAGAFLVFVLFTCQRYGSIPSLNGLLVYANVLHQYTIRLDFDSGSKITRYPHVFIAWLNLDLGVETCFFNGMDAYSKHYLRLCFPLYTLGLVGVVTLISKRSRWLAAKIKGQSIRVAALVVLLSYSTLFSAVFDAYRYATLHYSDGTEKLVWLCSGISEYWSKQHILLMVFMLPVALILAVVTILPLFHPILQNMSLRKHCRIKQLCTIFDNTFGAAMKHHCQFWSTVLFLLRVILTIDCSHSITNKSYFSIVVLMLVFAFVTSLQGVYKKWQYDSIEAVPLLNLALLLAVANGENGLFRHTFRHIVVAISIVIAALVFSMIVLYHGYAFISKSVTRWWLFNRINKCGDSLIEDEKNKLLDLVDDRDYYGSQESSTSNNIHASVSATVQ